MKKGNDSGGRGVCLNFNGKYLSHRRRNKMNNEILFFSGLKWKIDTGSGAPTKEEVEREVAVLCLCPRPFPRSVFPEMESSGM